MKANVHYQYILANENYHETGTRTIKGIAPPTYVTVSHSVRVLFKRAGYGGPQESDSDA